MQERKLDIIGDDMFTLSESELLPFRNKTLHLISLENKKYVKSQNK